MTVRIERERWTDLAIVCYFVVQTVARVATSPSFEMDESQQIVWSQALLPGYGPQPPLYTWLVIPFVRLLGPTVLPLAIVKNFLLAATCLIIVRIAREIGGSSRSATAAAAAFFLVPQFVWESQRDLTHSVLVTTLAAATLLAVVRAGGTGNRWYIAAAGLCSGVGMLGKYNFALFLISLLGALATFPEGRRLFSSRTIPLFLVPLVAVTAYPFHWIVTNVDASTATIHKISAGGRSTAWGALRLAGAAAMFVPALALLAGPPLIKGRRQPSPWRVALLGRTAAVAVGLCLVLLMTGGMANFKDRWMQPLLLPLCPYVAVRLEILAREGINALIVRCGAVVAVVVAIILPLRTTVLSKKGHPDRLAISYVPVGDFLARHGFTGGTILTDTSLLAGNVKRLHPQALVISADSDGMACSLPIQGNCYILWQGKGSEIPEKLSRVIDRAGIPTGVRSSRHDLPFGDSTVHLLSAGTTRPSGPAIPAGAKNPKQDS